MAITSVSSVLTYMFILLKMFSQTEEVKVTSYLKSATISSCCSTENIAVRSTIQCALTCSSQLKELCVGYRKDVNYCQICQIGPQSATPGEVGDVSYVTPYTGFALELQQGSHKGPKTSLCE